MSKLSRVKLRIVSLQIMEYQIHSLGRVKKTFDLQLGQVFRTLDLQLGQVFIDIRSLVRAGFQRYQIYSQDRFSEISNLQLGQVFRDIRSTIGAGFILTKPFLYTVLVKTMTTGLQSKKNNVFLKSSKKPKSK